MDGYDAKYWEELFAEEAKKASGESTEGEKKVAVEGDVGQ